MTVSIFPGWGAGPKYVNLLSRSGVRQQARLSDNQLRARTLLEERFDHIELWQRMSSNRSGLVREWQGSFLLPHVLDAIDDLKVFPEIVRGLHELGGNGWSPIGLAHELVRLAQLHARTPLSAAKVQLQVRGNVNDQEVDGLMEVDGLRSDGTAIEIKLIGSGWKYLDEKRMFQAGRYGLAQRVEEIGPVEYHVTTPCKIAPDVVRGLKASIPQLTIFQYQKLFTDGGEVTRYPRAMITR